MNVLPYGVDGWLVECADLAEVHGVAAAVRSRPGVVDVVPGRRSVLVVGAPPPYGVAALDGTAGREHVLRVAYDGEDLPEVGALTGLGEAEVVRRHAAGTYQVAFVGFSPGFGYLDGLDPALAVPRRATPRERVPAGSVAVAGDTTAVYPSASPGGWRLLGRTDAMLFDPDDVVRPALLAAGDVVRIEPVRDVGPAPAWPRPALDAGPVLVRSGGARTTVQDAGRPGWGAYGVPRGGAVDLASLARANSAVGNPPDAAALEMTLLGCDLVLDAPTVVAVAGARVEGRPDGEPVEVSGRLRIGPLRGGARTYLAFAGGLATPLVLGSRSTDTLAGLGPAPLAAGDRLAVGTPAGPARTADAPPARSGPVRLLPGPRADWVDTGPLHGAQWTVSPASDRTGVRMAGPRLAWRRAGELPSEALRPGAVQVPPDGAPIVMLAGCPTTGGYPVVAVVHPDDLGAVAQARPGTGLRFSPGR